MNIGDKVVYPMHGAGVIEGIESNEVGGVVKDYYILKLPVGNLKLMLPVDTVDQIGLREIINKDKVDEVVDVLKSKPDNIQGSWNKRFNETLERLRSGDILDAAAVARNLSIRNRKRKISGGEKRLMDLSRQILISELVYACDKTPEDITKWFENVIGTNAKD
ncbi:MAG: CarD family transcriptional regulator [Selenomonadaceae bacterium]|nr:CarD family transcriptional regulator [Selenomonadaceae bacterium]